MKILKALFHFLGGIYLAIALISTAAIAVIVGTILESKTDSHLLAASWTYENPLFFFLLALFFVNILFSALRRWPFKKRHIPFLITHLGLLMIIGGTMVKNRFGLQGQLTVWEGSGNQQVVLPHTHALLIEGKDKSSPANSLIALNSFRPEIYSPFHLPQLTCKLIGYAPHVKEELETWIKGPNAYIAGFPAIPVQEWSHAEPFPEATPYHFALSTDYPSWSILALRTSHVKEAIELAYKQNLIIQFKAKEGEAPLVRLPLQEALNSSFSFMEGKIKTGLELSLSDQNEKETPCLNLTWSSLNTPKKEKWTIPLQGQDALLVKPHSLFWSNVPFHVDLERGNPLLCLIEDDQGNTTFFAFDSHGRVHSENFNPSHLQSMLIYENGFAGYGVQAVVPFPSFSTSRESKEKSEEYALNMQLREAMTHQPSLAPPLSLFKHACLQAEVDFCDAFVGFLTLWNEQSGFIYHPNKTISDEIQKVFKHLNWNEVSPQDQHAIQWNIKLLGQLENGWKQGEDPIVMLERHHWPFIEELKEESALPNPSLLNKIAQQVYSLTNYLPPLDLPLPSTYEEMGNHLSAFFRMYGIDYRSLILYQGNQKEVFDNLENYWKAHTENRNHQQSLVFETPISHRIIPDTGPSKLEDQCPGVVFEIQEGQSKQTLALAYNAINGGLKWPILNGKYVMRFQPNLKELPYRIRLRQARQIPYPNSQQIYSYESDVLISENDKPSIEQTLSMNKVYETLDGYRFYLSGIGSSPDETLKRIQLAVNYDPAKYLLTYPGAFLVFLGSILLFWMKKWFSES